MLRTTAPTQRVAKRIEPRSKNQVLDQLLSMNFKGDLRQLSPVGAKLTRIAPHKIAVHLPETDTKFEIIVRRPKTKQMIKSLRAKYRSKGTSAHAHR